MHKTIKLKSNHVKHDPTDRGVLTLMLSGPTATTAACAGNFLFDGCRVQQTVQLSLGILRRYA